MNRKRTFVAAALAGLLAAPAAFAEESGTSMPKFGLGVGVNLGNAFSGGALTSSPVSIYAPINLSERFRLEPSFGYWYVGRGFTTSVLEGSTSKGGYAVDLALGAFYLMHPTTPFTVYLGGRLGLVFSGRSDANNAGVVTSVSETDLFVNPTLGLEWAVSREFSVGGEAAVAFRFYFDPSVTVGAVSTSVSRSKFGTGFDAVLFMRLYF